MLTDIQIKNAKPSDKPYPLKDFGNLSIVIYPSKAKIWQHRFSMYPNGKRKEKIRRGGHYPSMSIRKLEHGEIIIMNYSLKELLLQRNTTQSSK